MILVNSMERCGLDASRVEEILEFDTANMAEFFAELGLELPVGKRRLSFKHPGTIVVARDETGRLAGYLEYGPGWENAAECYVSSIQIAPEHRTGSLLLRLIRHAVRNPGFSDETIVKTHVQENNAKAIRLLERVGFRIDPASARKGTLCAGMVLPIRWPAKVRDGES